MIAPVFVDTNVLVYARDGSDPLKNQRAQDWMRLLWEWEVGRISPQVLHEYYVTVTRKLDPGLSRPEAREEIGLLSLWLRELSPVAVVEEAWTVEDRYGLSLWDALIVAAARLTRCRILLTEDLHEGLELDGLTIVNPFHARPQEVMGR